MMFTFFIFTLRYWLGRCLWNNLFFCRVWLKTLYLRQRTVLIIVKCVTFVLQRGVMGGIHYSPILIYQV